MCYSASMQRSDPGAVRRSALRLRTAMLATCTVMMLASGTSGWPAPSVRAFAIESEPSGAEVFTITGRAGTTPAFVSERDIYPNTFPKQKVDEYGAVILRRAGCAEYRKRVTLEDLKRGIKAQLNCEAETRAASQSPVVTATTASGSKSAAATSRPPGAETADQRIRWLRTIEELREHGLLSSDEERRIRKRILGGD